MGNREQESGHRANCRFLDSPFPILDSRLYSTYTNTNSPSQTTSTKCQYQATASKPKWLSALKWPLAHDRAQCHVHAVEAGQHEEG